MVEICLSILLVLTNVYWAYVCHKLVNKVMSRNYAEFMQGERMKRSPVAPAKPSIALVDPIAEDNARKANNLFT